MIPAKKIHLGNGVYAYGERDAEPGDKIWWKREYEWADDQCRCYKHRGTSGNSKRCDNLGSIELTDPDNIEERRDRDLDPVRKTFCPTCWHQCRTEVAVQHPDEIAQASRNITERRREPEHARLMYP